MNKLISLARVLFDLGHPDAAAIVAKLAMNGKPIVPRTLHSYDIGPSDPSLPELKPYEDPESSIGFSGAEVPHFMNDMKTLFANTPDKWVIIVFDDLRDLEKRLNSPLFKEWFDSKGYPENSKILVVGSEKMSGDNESAKWVIHDIIGHCIFNFIGTAEYSASWFEEPGKEFRFNIVQNIMSYLVENDAPVSRSYDHIDGINDIYASIVLGDLKKETALDLAESKEELYLVESMFDLCDKWVKSIPSDSSKFTIVRPW